MSFTGKVRTWAALNGWNALEEYPSGSGAGLRFDVQGNPILVTVSQMGDVIEFEALCVVLSYPSATAANGGVSNFLLNQNSTLKWAFWTLTETPMGAMYSIMSNQREVDLDADRFGQIVKVILTQLDLFERMLAQLRNM